MVLASVEGFWKAHIRKETRPSDTLNEAFTPLVEAFDRKIRQTKWLDNPSVIRYTPTRTFIPFSNYDNQLPIFTKAPSALANYRIVNFKAPIGDYHEEWANQLLTAANTLAHEAFDPKSNINIFPETRKVNRTFRRPLERYTFRGSALRFSRKSWDGSLRKGPQGTFLDAIQSVLYVAGLLTRYKVQGYEDNPERLLLQLAEEGLFSKLSLVIPPTVTASMGDLGITFTSPTITTQKNGELAIRKDILTDLVAFRRDRFRYTSAGGDLLDRQGCPVGRKLKGHSQTGVDMLAKLFAKTVIAQKKNRNQTRKRTIL